MDASISWSYIVEQMEHKFGIKPDNNEKVAFAEIQRHIDLIWIDFVDDLFAKEVEE